MVSGSAIVFEKPWAHMGIHGSGGRQKRWKRERWELTVKKAFLHWVGNCWANLLYEHVIETKQTAQGKISTERKHPPMAQGVFSFSGCSTKVLAQIAVVFWGVPCSSRTLWGTQHWDQWGRADIELKVPGHGKTYLHILAWYHFHNQEYSSWAEFREDCATKGLDVDHGKAGCWKLDGTGSWRYQINVHKLALGDMRTNRGQGASIRDQYFWQQESLNRQRQNS